MDRARRRSGFLIAASAGLALIGACGVWADAPRIPRLRAQRWLSPGADAARILSRRPVECLKTAANPAEAWSIEVGRAAFRSPLLLGGQAARAGLSCAACHRNGRGNPDFHFPGVSGAPGTADVTNFVFSTHRGDRLADPRLIPDLGGPEARLKVSQTPGSPALKIFIHGLVTEEFDGPEPAPAVLAGLTAYVRALDPAACPAGGDEPETAAAALADVDRALDAATGALARDDGATAVAMVAAARARLGDLAERYPGDALKSARERVTAASLALGGVIERIRLGDLGAARSLESWRRSQAAWRDALLAAQFRSLYNPVRLAEALGAQRGPVQR